MSGYSRDWPIQPLISEDGDVYTIRQWTDLLGEIWFGLGVDQPIRYSPTFRSLIPFLARSGPDGYTSPFEPYRRMPEWAKQVNNAFLLQLDWEIAAEWQELKGKRKLLDTLRKAATGGAIQVLGGSIGELEAERVRLESEVRRQQGDLTSFQVHPQYREIEREASQLTAEIHDAANANIVDGQLLASYERSIEDEQAPPIHAIVRLYEEAGATLPGIVVRELRDVEQFHSQLVQNRRQFLLEETRSIERRRAQRQVDIRDRTERRASLLEVLQHAGALEEFLSLQEHHLGLVSRLNEATQRIALLREVEAGASQLRIDEEVIRQRAVASLGELSERRDEAVRLFNEYSEALYDSPGNLVIDLGAAGYRFRVEIVRSGSGGVGHMKVLLYDLVTSSIWSDSQSRPGFLIHDSLVFEGVDERQVAGALQLAQQVATAKGIQYICMLNSDQVPTHDLPDEFNLRSFTRLVLNDQPETASLLGIRF